MRTLYCAVDLHSNNGYYGIVENSGKRVFGKKLPNKIEKVLEALEKYKNEIKTIAVESTYNWYWLVDSLIENGYNVKLANPVAIKQYSGIKNTDDKNDAFFLAELLRLNILPEGYIFKKEERYIRDMLRRRMFFVNQRTAQMLSLQNMLCRQSGNTYPFIEIQKMKKDDLLKILGHKINVFMAVQNLDTIRVLSEKIKMIENHVLEAGKLNSNFEKLLTIPGIGKILGLTIMYETGDISRFRKSGNYTSYCRCVRAERISNNKKKGSNNRKNGNKYLSWAFVEGAHKMKQYCPQAASFYERKRSKKCGALATKSLAAKLSKCAYYVLKNKEDFDVKKMFG